MPAVIAADHRVSTWEVTPDRRRVALHEAAHALADMEVDTPRQYAREVQVALAGIVDKAIRGGR